MAGRTYTGPELTPEVALLIVDTLKSGCFVSTAYKRANVSKLQYEKWRTKGWHDRNAGKDTIYSQFYRDICQCEAGKEALHTQTLNDSSDWRAHAWALERVDPEAFSQQHQVKVRVDREIDGILEVLSQRLNADEYFKVLSILTENDGEGKAEGDTANHRGEAARPGFVLPQRASDGAVDQAGGDSGGDQEPPEGDGSIGP